MSNYQSSAPSLKRLGQAFAALLLSHLELLGIELQEEKARWISIVILAACSLVFALMAFFAASAWVIIYFWDTHRLLATAGVLGFFVLALLFCILRIRQQVGQGGEAFRATREELSRHRELLP